MKKIFSRLFPFLLLLLTAVALVLGWFELPPPQPQSTQIGRKMEPFTLPALGGGTFSPADWQGEPVVLYVFASWCPTCLRQHPLLEELAESGKARIMGLAWKDDPEKLKQWLLVRGNPFHRVGLDQSGTTTMALALTGVPELFVLDRNGVIVYHDRGTLTEAEFRKLLIPLLEKLHAE